jgi:hypothetical protein
MVVGHHGHHGLLVNKKQVKNVNVVHERVLNQHLNLMVKRVKELLWK